VGAVDALRGLWFSRLFLVSWFLGRSVCVRLARAPLTPALASMRQDKESVILLVVALLPLAGVAIGALILVPDFIPVFAPFGTSLPVSTKVLLLTYQWWGAALVVPVLLWEFPPKQRSRVPACIFAGVGLAAALSLFGWWSLYAPILEPGG